jgi:hypothetical protein
MKLLYPRMTPVMYQLKSKAICFVFLFCTVISFSSFTGNTNALAHTKASAVVVKFNVGTPAAGKGLTDYPGDLQPVQYSRIIILGLQVVLMPALSKKDKDNDVSFTDNIKIRLGLNKLIYC